MRRIGASSAVVCSALQSLSGAMRHATAKGSSTTVVTPGREVQEEMHRRKKAGKLPTPGQRRKTIDTIMGDILEKSMDHRKEEKPPDMTEIYDQASAKMYKDEYGQEPPSQQRDHHKFIPLPPNVYMMQVSQFELYDEDPAPERSITRENPVMTREMQVNYEDKKKRGVELTDAEKLMDEVRERSIHTFDGPVDHKARFVDAIEELGYWELRYLQFLRDCPVGLRRTLPMQHEHYRHLTHRIVRANDHFITCRNDAMREIRGSSRLYADTEDRIARTRQMYTETFKSLANLQADPAKMKRWFTGKIINMSAAEWEEWQEDDRRARNQLMAEFCV